MFKPSIKRKIVGIARGLIVLMVITSALSIVMADTVRHLLDELKGKYIPAYGDLSRANIRSLERSLALRQMVIAKMQVPPDEAAYADRLRVFEDKAPEVEQEAHAARKLINSIMEDPSTPSNNIALARLDDRIETSIAGYRNHLNVEDAQLLKQLNAQDFAEVRRTLARADALREEFNAKINEIRSDMLAQVYASATTVISNQWRTILISAIVTTLTAILGLLFAIIVSGGITRPVQQLLASTREVEAGRYEGAITVTTQDEIGQLTTAFNRMIEQLRRNERVRETFGRYIDPRIVKWLIDQPAMAAAQGQRRIVTVLFCDMRGFSALSEGVTPQGLVKVMNRYLTTMSEPIRDHKGIIDKYIGDAIMAYWGPPFIEQANEAELACQAAISIRPGCGIARGIAGTAWRAAHTRGVRSSDRHCHRGVAGRQHRLRVHDELYGDGRRGQSGFAPGGGEQDLRQPRIDFRGNEGRGGRGNRSARDRSRDGAWAVPATNRVRDHRAARRTYAGPGFAANPLFRRAGGISRASMERGANRPQGSARNSARRRTIADPPGPDRDHGKRSAGGRLGRFVAS